MLNILLIPICITLVQGKTLESNVALGQLPPCHRPLYTKAMEGDLFSALELNEQYMPMTSLGHPIPFPWGPLVERMKQGAKAGDPVALYALGVLYLKAPNVKSDSYGDVVFDRDKGMEYMQKAAELGEPRAMVKLAELTTVLHHQTLLVEHSAKFKNISAEKRPMLVIEKEDPMAIHWGNRAYQNYVRRAESGDKEAISVLGSKGLGVKGVMSPTEEARWKQKAIEVGDPDLLFREADEVLRDASTKLSREESRRGWEMMLQAAEAHSPNAMQVVAEHYWVGFRGGYWDQDLKKDRAKAKEWVRKMLDYFGPDWAPLGGGDSCVFPTDSLGNVDLKKLFSAKG